MAQINNITGIDVKSTFTKKHIHPASEVRFADGEDIQAKYDAGAFGGAIKYYAEDGKALNVSDSQDYGVGDSLLSLSLVCPITDHTYEVGDLCLIKNAVKIMTIAPVAYEYTIFECVKAGPGYNLRQSSDDECAYFLPLNSLKQIGALNKTDFKGIIKGKGGNLQLATDGTDYISPTSLSTKLNEFKSTLNDTYLPLTGGEIHGNLKVEGELNGVSWKTNSLTASSDISAAAIQLTSDQSADQVANHFLTKSSLGMIAVATNEQVLEALGIQALIDASSTKAILVTLTASGWKDNTQTVTATGVIADENTQEIRVMPHTSSIMDYKDAGILCTAQAQDSLTFTCETQPEADIKVYINMEKVMWGGVIEPPKFTVTFMNDGQVYDTVEVEPGGTAVPSKGNPTVAPYGNTGEYKFAGWSGESGGKVDPDILKNIQSSKTVYAVWQSAGPIEPETN